MGLEPDSKYKLIVHALNGVSELSNTKSSSYIVAMTDKAGETCTYKSRQHFHTNASVLTVT